MTFVEEAVSGKKKASNFFNAYNFASRYTIIYSKIAARLGISKEQLADVLEGRATIDAILLNQHEYRVQRWLREQLDRIQGVS